MSKEEISKLNIHQKLLSIADMAGVLQKNKNGFNYKYVEELDIQAKVTAGMQRYGVMLYTSLVPGALEVMPYRYDKPKSRKEDGKIVEYTVPVNEIIVKSEVKYTWVNVENPDDKVECYWAYIGQMEDASQAFGAGTTYGNRYYLLKALQLATTEDDPDKYRAKQRATEQYEDDKAEKEIADKLKAIKDLITAKGTSLIKAGVSKNDIMGIVAKHNGGNGNPSSIQTIEVGEMILEDFEKLSGEAKSVVKAKAKKTTEKSEEENK